MYHKLRGPLGLTKITNNERKDDMAGEERTPWDERRRRWRRRRRWWWNERPTKATIQSFILLKHNGEKRR